MELKVKNLTKQFGDFNAVNNVNMTLNCGVYGLLGVNGAGKTTLMRMICGLLKPSNGNILWNDEDISKMGASYRKEIGYLPQEFGYYRDLTVEDYLGYISTLKGIGKYKSKKIIRDVLERVGMSDKRRKKMRTLSGGMVRRVGIAQAILNNPGLLILDEPTAGLDPGERIRFRNLISELSEDRIVILSTHIVSDIEFSAGEIFMMRDGMFQISGTAEEIISSMDSQVWSLNVRKEDITDISENYLISNITRDGNLSKVRILSKDKPREDAHIEECSLEDVSLYYFGRSMKEGSYD